MAVTADIEQMFHSFIVKKEDRDFLCFLWFKEKDTSQVVDQNPPLEEKQFNLIGLEMDAEVRPFVTVLSTDDSHLECQRFKRFFSWRSSVRAIASLIHFAQT